MSAMLCSPFSFFGWPMSGPVSGVAGSGWRGSAVHAQEQGFALAAAAAQAGGAEPATAAAQFQGQVQRDPGTRRADRMPHRDRATVDVHVLIGDVEITHR